MEPINRQDVLIRLLKDGHISNDEFKALWEPEKIITTTESVWDIDPQAFLWDPKSAPFYYTTGSITHN